MAKKTTPGITDEEFATWVTSMSTKISDITGGMAGSTLLTGTVLTDNTSTIYPKYVTYAGGTGGISDPLGFGGIGPLGPAIHNGQRGKFVLASGTGGPTYYQFVPDIPEYVPPLRDLKPILFPELYP